MKARILRTFAAMTNRADEMCCAALPLNRRRVLSASASWQSQMVPVNGTKDFVALRRALDNLLILYGICYTTWRERERPCRWIKE